MELLYNKYSLYEAFQDTSYIIVDRQLLVFIWVTTYLCLRAFGQKDILVALPFAIFVYSLEVSEWALGGIPLKLYQGSPKGTPGMT